MVHVGLYTGAIVHPGMYFQKMFVIVTSTKIIVQTRFFIYFERLAMLLVVHTSKTAFLCCKQCFASHPPIFACERMAYDVRNIKYLLDHDVMYVCRVFRAILLKRTVFCCSECLFNQATEEKKLETA